MDVSAHVVDTWSYVPHHLTEPLSYGVVRTGSRFESRASLCLASTDIALLIPASARLYAETPAELRDAVRWPAVVYAVIPTASIPSTTRMHTAITIAIPSSFLRCLTAGPPIRSLAAVKRPLMVVTTPRSCWEIPRGREPDTLSKAVTV